jgi:hypothetical protein
MRGSIGLKKDNPFWYPNRALTQLSKACRLIYNIFNSLLEIMSYATTPFATGMQLPVACNYFCNYAPFLGVYATMVQL